MGVEVAIAIAAAISKVAISNGHCTAKRRSEIAMRAEINVYISIGCSRFSAANPSGILTYYLIWNNIEKWIPL